MLLQPKEHLRMGLYLLYLGHFKNLEKLRNSPLNHGKGYRASGFKSPASNFASNEVLIKDKDHLTVELDLFYGFEHLGNLGNWVLMSRKLRYNRFLRFFEISSGYLDFLS